MEKAYKMYPLFFNFFYDPGKLNSFSTPVFLMKYHSPRPRTHCNIHETV